MSPGFFTTLVTQPLYNGIVSLLHLAPGLDLGLAVIFFTIIIRMILFPLAQKSLKTQLALQSIQPRMEEIKIQYKNDPQQQAQKMMLLYKEYGVNPFASFLFLLIQLPIIFGLYFVFLKGGFPTIDPEFLYSFVVPPEKISTLFLGIFDVTQKSALLAAFAGISQLLQAQFMKMPTPSNNGDKPSFGSDFAKSLSFQMKYLFPIIIVFIAYALPGSVALYWITSNLFSVGQEIYLRRHQS